MKLADIKVGKEYAACENARDREQHPVRRVKVIKIVHTTDKRYQQITNTWKEVSVRKVSVKFLDSSPPIRRSFGGQIDNGKKSSTLTVEPTKILAPWEEVAPAIKKEHEDKQKVVHAKKEYDRRLRALGLGQRCYIYVNGVNDASFAMFGSDPATVEKMLSLMEAGKASKAKS